MGRPTILGRSPAARPLVKKSLPFVALFGGSTGAMFLTGSYFIVAIWVAIWLVASNGLGRSRPQGFLAFFLGVWFLYPDVCSDFMSIHEKNVVLGVCLMVFALKFRRKIGMILRQHGLMKVMLVVWIIWGLAAYFPVLLSSFSKYVLRIDLPPFLNDIATGDTLLKTAGYIIPSIFSILVPCVYLRDRNDWEGLLKIIRLLTFVVIAGAFAKYLFGITLVNESYSKAYSSYFRLHTFSIPDANGFGRLLLMPTLLFVALSFRSLRLRWLMISGAGFLSVLLTLSRTTYFSLAIGVVVIVVLNTLRLRGAFTAIIMGLVIVVLANSLSLRALFSSDVRLSSRNNLDGRLALHAAALSIAEKNPFFGAFPGGYQREMANRGFKSRTAIVSPHNMLLNIVVEWGVPMALVLLIALLAALHNGWKAMKVMRARLLRENQAVKALALFCTSLSISYLAHGLTEVIPPHFVFFLTGLSYALIDSLAGGSLMPSNASTRALVKYHRWNSSPTGIQISSANTATV